MVPHVLKKIQVKLATVFEVPRKKSIKLVNLLVLLVGGFILFFLSVTSVGFGNNWKKERKMTPSFMTQIYLVLICGQTNITFLQSSI